MSFKSLGIKCLSVIADVRLYFKLSKYNVANRSSVYSWRIYPFNKSELIVGSNSSVRTSIVFEKLSACVEIGDRTFLGGGLISVASAVSIGDDVMLAWGVTISDHNSHSIRFSERVKDVEQYLSGTKNWDGVSIERVKICNKVWVGFNTIILKGVTIGEGAIVGAGSVVTKDILPWTVVAGNPAKMIKEIPESER